MCEVPGLDTDDRHACDFANFVANPLGTTPEDLLQNDLYAEEPVPLKGGPYRATSMAMLGMALSMSREDLEIGGKGSSLLGLTAQGSSFSTGRKRGSSMRRLSKMFKSSTPPSYTSAAGATTNAHTVEMTTSDTPAPAPAGTLAVNVRDRVQRAREAKQASPTPAYPPVMMVSASVLDEGGPSSSRLSRDSGLHVDPCSQRSLRERSGLYVDGDEDNEDEDDLNADGDDGVDNLDLQRGAVMPRGSTVREIKAAVQALPRRVSSSDL